MSTKQINFAGLLLMLACSVVLAEDKPVAAETKPAEATATTATTAATSKLSAADQAAKQAKIREMRDATLKRLLKAKPEVKDEIAKAEGYAVFDASQTNLLLLVTSKGGGVIVDNANQKETFMKMAKVGTGPGLGYKAFKQILVFKSRGLLDQFISVGADVSASADATVKLNSESKGMVLDGTTSFNPSMSVYQITDKGVMLQANWGGVAYLPDSDLNAPAK
jgi:lipid-binding SYLF domain-containing protein